MVDTIPGNNNQVSNQHPTSCLSCGTTQGLGRKRYCSIPCRQALRRCLNVRSGLLKALHIRYGAFYFTTDVVILDLLPFSEPHIYSFYLSRRPNKKPVDDFKRMANMLGNAWWLEKKRTNRSYLASRHILDQAFRNTDPIATVTPHQTRIPSVGSGALTLLKLTTADLTAHSHLDKTIKQAYRKQARVHHPDQGGNAAAFRKIHHAYSKLAQWAQHPTFINRRGFPDKWFYNGRTNHWVQPTPLPR